MNTISNTINMTIRIDKDLKKSVDSLFKSLGTNTNSAINMFLRQCEREQGLVFTPTMAPKPSKELLEALEEADEMINNPKKYPRYNNREDLEKALLSDD